jgi:hypothetical protein
MLAGLRRDSRRSRRTRNKSTVSSGLVQEPAKWTLAPLRAGRLIDTSEPMPVHSGQGEWRQSSRQRPSTGRTARTISRDLRPKPSLPTWKAVSDIGCFARPASATHRRVDPHRLSANSGDAIVRPRVEHRFIVARSDLSGAASCPNSQLIRQRRSQAEVGSCMLRSDNTDARWGYGQPKPEGACSAPFHAVAPARFPCPSEAHSS